MPDDLHFDDLHTGDLHVQDPHTTADFASGAPEPSSDDFHPDDLVGSIIRPVKRSTAHSIVG